MNKLIFDKYMHESVSIFQKLALPVLNNQKTVPDCGKIKTPLFEEDFRQFNNHITNKTL
jgi:hypothetical protein